MTQYCFLDGKIVPFAKAGIALNDLGVLRGYGVFDFFRTFNGKPFLLERNLRRFRSSAEAVGLIVPYTDQQITTAITELQKRSEIPEAVFRLVLTGGVSDDNISPGEKPTFYILISPFVPLPDAYYRDGVKLMTHEHLRIFPEAKSLNYVTAVKLQSEKKTRGAFEILYTYKNFVFECATSNFFILKGEKLITPHRDILGGITRSIVLELAQKFLTVEERDVSLDEVKTADEAFITAANKGILPVVTIDKLKIGNGIVGPQTKKLMELFKSFIETQ